MFTPKGEQLPSSMCQHDMVDKRLWRSSFNFTFILQVNGVIDKGCQWLLRKFKLPLSLNQQLWQQKRPFLNLMSFQIFRPSPCMTYFMLLLMGLHRRFREFFLLGLPIVHSAFSNVVFYLDFDAFFFLFLFLCQVFFLYLFIYL